MSRLAQMSEENSTPRLHTGKLAASIGRGTFFGVVSRLAQVGTRLVTVPIVIAHLGLGGYGIWAIIMTTAAYMRFGSIGVKSAFQKYVAEATGNGGFEAANKLLSTGCAIMLVLSLAGLVPIAIFSRQLATMAGVPPEFLISTAHSFTVLAIIMMLSNVGAVYEAIVMGGHRVDLSGNFTTFFTVAEAVAIVILLHFGGGLFAMASVMAASEVGFIASCYVASKKIVPQIRLSPAHVTKKAVRELVRFAGSYQLVNVLEVLYVSIVPITVLRIFGTDAAGIYALAARLVQAAQMIPSALILPILSGGAMVFASGSAAEMRTLITKSFKVTLALGLLPLAFIAIFGPTIVFAWTGESAPSLQVAFYWVSAAGLFQALSLLGLVLYRSSGKALLDNIRQALRIVILLSIAVAAHRLGFYGVLAGLALAELVGIIFMLFALTKAFEAFRVGLLLPDALRLTAAIAIVLSAAWAASLLPVPALSSARLTAVLHLAVISFASLIAAWPALVLTKSVTSKEGRALVGALLPHRGVPKQLPVEIVG
jgi:O-antigen/teichoic acid export membrane protein